METIIKPPNINTKGVRAFFTSRYFSESHANIKEALLKGPGSDKDKVYLPVQKHTNNVHVLDIHFDPVVADAVITTRTDVLIGVLVADCVPVLIYDPARKVIGAVHAGWRGTADGILPQALLKMNNVYNSRPDNVLVAIGPSIRKCSYEVKTDVKDAVENKTGAGQYYETRGDRFMMDLAEANRLQAINSGISEDNIWKSDECTFCNPDKFYSYRYAKEPAGRQGGFIGMW